MGVSLNRVICELDVVAGPGLPDIQFRREAQGPAPGAAATAALLAAGLSGESHEGEPLEAGLRSRMESELGADLSGVRVHTGRVAARLAERLGAEAFTLGRDVYFGEGRFRRDAEGEALLVHELGHVGGADEPEALALEKGYAERAARGEPDAPGASRPAARAPGALAATPMAPSGAPPVTVAPVRGAPDRPVARRAKGAAATGGGGADGGNVDELTRHKGACGLDHLSDDEFVRLIAERVERRLARDLSVERERG
ncbi:MAG: DUF4157 domain-containing protein [Planctomycetes bacterium]|nr:DUF4157 domain-containing protein [Planctomycetota bacterium]